MNKLAALRLYSCFIGRYGVPCKSAFRNYTYCSYFWGMQREQTTDLSYLPYKLSCNQIRGFAKKAQGKTSRGSKGKTTKLTDEEMADVINIEDFREQLHQVTEKLKKDYVENLSIRSAANNITNIIVKIDGEDYPLNELGVISKKNPNLIAINLSDFPEAIKPAVQAIIDSGSGLNPQQDGTMVYLAIPKMTREHREILAKNAKSVFVRAKDEIRLIQNSFVKEAKEKTELSEDLVFNTANQIKAIADQCTADLEKIMKDKQKELLGDS